MKGSTLHRSGLTREKMGLLASLTQTDKKQNTRSQLNNQYYNKPVKNHELDILWGNVQKGIQKVHNAAKGSQGRSPAVYLIIGFIAGALCMSFITFIVSVSAMAPNGAVTAIEKDNQEDDTPVENNNISNNKEEKAKVEVVTVRQPIVTQEKYIVKKGDTLNGIAYRFYGKYDPSKIQEIQKINNISNPEAISIGQELNIPVSQDR